MRCKRRPSRQVPDDRADASWTGAPKSTAIDGGRASRFEWGDAMDGELMASRWSSPAPQVETASCRRSILARIANIKVPPGTGFRIIALRER